MLQLQAFFPNATYVWNDQSTGSSIEVRESGIYSVKTKKRACEREGSIKVAFYDCPEDIPNVITPNNDAKNETFVIKEIRSDQWKITIVSRWGEQVYKNDNYHNNWDAEGNPSGVYFYHLENTNSRRTYKGWIQVLK